MASGEHAQSCTAGCKSDPQGGTPGVTQAPSAAVTSATLKRMACLGIGLLYLEKREGQGHPKKHSLTTSLPHHRTVSTQPTTSLERQVSSLLHRHKLSPDSAFSTMPTQPWLSPCSCPSLPPPGSGTLPLPVSTPSFIISFSPSDLCHGSAICFPISVFL